MKNLLFIPILIFTTTVMAQTTKPRMFKCISATTAGVKYTLEGCVSEGTGMLDAGCGDNYVPLKLTRTVPEVRIYDDVKRLVTRQAPVTYEMGSIMFDYTAVFSEEPSLTITANSNANLGNLQLGSLNLNYTAGDGVTTNAFSFHLMLGGEELKGQFRAVGCTFTPVP